MVVAVGEAQLDRAVQLLHYDLVPHSNYCRDLIWRGARGAGACGAVGADYCASLGCCVQSPRDDVLYTDFLGMCPQQRPCQVQIVRRGRN